MVRPATIHGDAADRRRKMRGIAIQEGVTAPKTPEEYALVARAPKRVAAIRDALRQQENLLRNYRDGFLTPSLLAETMAEVWAEAAQTTRLD